MNYLPFPCLCLCRYLLERAVVGLLRLAIRLMSRGGLTPQVGCQTMHGLYMDPKWAEEVRQHHVPLSLITFHTQVQAT